jgi:hypothetical protein
VNCSSKWGPEEPPIEKGPTQWEREGQTAATAEQVGKVVAAVGGTCSVNLGCDDAPPTATFTDGSLGGSAAGWYLSRLLEPDFAGRPFDGDRVANQFIPWRSRLFGLADGRNLRSFLETTLGRRPEYGDDFAIRTALARDEQDRRREAQADTALAEIEASVPGLIAAIRATDILKLLGEQKPRSRRKTTHSEPSTEAKQGHRERDLATIRH